MKKNDFKMSLHHFVSILVIQNCKPLYPKRKNSLKDPPKIISKNMKLKILIIKKSSSERNFSNRTQKNIIKNPS